MRINPDLTVFNEVPGRELPKNTRAANPLTASGNPNPKIDPKDDKVPTVRGVCLFGPGTGGVRTGSEADIAGGFLGTISECEGFLGRHADFLSSGKETKNGPYEKLGKVLRAESDEGAWAKPYGATSRPFDPPKSGTVAVKMINHFGGEVLAVLVKIPTATGKGKKQMWASR